MAEPSPDALMLAGKYPEARAAFEAAVRAGGDKKTLLFRIAECHVNEGKPDSYTAALKICVELQTLDPAKGHLVRGMVYGRLGRKVDSQREYANAARYGDSVAKASLEK